MEDGLGDVIENAPAAKCTSLNPCFSGGWSRSAIIIGVIAYFCLVLILVLVEDGLGGQRYAASSKNATVLILVLVEDGLGVKTWKITIHGFGVLILVLVEDGLGD